jgi:hypothetical protein
MLEALLGRTRKLDKIAELEAELEQAPMPEGAEYLWRIFNRLHARRGSTMVGPAMLTWGEFDAFSRLSGTRLVPWEIEVLEGLDYSFIASSRGT